MNERIRELIKQATVEVQLYYGPAGISHTKKFDKEKFAELIVRECADQCTTDGSFCAEVVWGKQFNKKILKHFGVEE